MTWSIALIPRSASRLGENAPFPGAAENACWSVTCDAAGSTAAGRSSQPCAPADAPCQELIFLIVENVVLILLAVTSRNVDGLLFAPTAHAISAHAVTYPRRAWSSKAATHTAASPPRCDHAVGLALPRTGRWGRWNLVARDRASLLPARAQQPGSRLVHDQRIVGPGPGSDQNFRRGPGAPHHFAASGRPSRIQLISWSSRESTWSRNEERVRVVPAGCDASRRSALGRTQSHHGPSWDTTSTDRWPRRCGTSRASNSLSQLGRCGPSECRVAPQEQDYMRLRLARRPSWDVV